MALHEIFSDPPAEFRQAPFWFWNHRLDAAANPDTAGTPGAADRPDEQTLAWQIEQMKDKGLGGFVMHARHGLMTPYLSDLWFDCIRFCCGKARELGMMAWAYDERDWPSGPAAGEVIAGHENRLSYLRLVEEEASGPGTVALGGDVVCAYAAGPDGKPSRIKATEWHAPKGTSRLLKAVRFECPPILWFESYLDTLNPKACRKFVRSTYDRHERQLGELKELGLAGFFTDEPALSTYPDDLGRIPWTHSLPEVFEKAKGYGLLDHLPALFTAGEAGAQVRYDYWDVVTAMFERAFFKTIAKWCGTRGLQLIGHPLGEEPLFFQFRCLGNIFRYLRHFDMPGMDNLGMQIGEGGPGGIVPKIIASAALLAGRERTMTETFGESGWGLTLDDMKWISDWQIVNGINYIIPHAFYYSVAGRRKKDSPPSEFFQAPFWPHYRAFADYTARLTAAMTGGEHVAKIAVFYPMSSLWADFAPGKNGETKEMPPAIQDMEDSFRAVCETLQRIHRDFVVVDEETFAKAKVQGNSFTVNGLAFEALVVPPCTAIRKDALAALKRVAKRCVTVLTGAPREPVLVLGKRGPEPDGRFDLAGLPSIHALAQPNIFDMEEALDGIVPGVVIENAPEVQCLHRRKEGKDLYFFANTSRKPVSATVSLETIGFAEIWDAETGEAYPAPGQHVLQDRLEIPLNFASAGSCLVVVEPAVITASAPLTTFKSGHRLNVCKLWHFTPENGNFLTLKRWDLDIRTRHHVTEVRYETLLTMPEHIANMRLILDEVPACAYNVPEAARPIIAQETDAIVSVNGEPVAEELYWEVDPRFRVLDLRGRCGPGEHRIEITIKNNGWFPQPPLGEYAWLAGDFAIDGPPGSQRIVPVRGIKPGPWEEQGFPYFSGTGAYYADIDVPAELLGRRVFLDAGRVGSLLDLEVNGMSAGVRVWPPYRLDVTEYLHGGMNFFVLKVSNSSRNFFEGPDPYKPSGLLEDVWLDFEGG